MLERITPLLWLLFSAGGTVAALLFPVHLFLTGLAFPLGWLEPPRYEVLHRLLTHPVIRLYLFVLISLPLFHWAHRFRYTLYDGLQLKHLTALIAVLCYGAALAGTAMTTYLLWTLPPSSRCSCPKRPGCQRRGRAKRWTWLGSAPKPPRRYSKRQRGRASSGRRWGRQIRSRRSPTSCLRGPATMPSSSVHYRRASPAG